MLYNVINIIMSLLTSEFTSLYNYLINSKYSKYTKQLSWILIPIACFIIYNKKYIKYFNYIFIYIALIGIIDNYFQFKIYKSFFKYYKSLFVYYSVILLHIILLYPLINIKKYMKPNIINLILSIIAIFIIIYLPYWPYELSRQIFIAWLIIINILCILLYYLYIYLIKS
jgi:hypothetical protein